MAKTLTVADSRPARDTRNCTCSRLRRAGRQVTQLYDRRLEAAGVTIGQFGLLACLARRSAESAAAIGIGALADERGMDPTTLTRNLKPLVEHGWVIGTRDGRDRRVRAVAITPAGRQKFRSALPLWQAAEEELEAKLGAATLAALNGLLEVSLDKVAS